MLSQPLQLAMYCNLAGQRSGLMSPPGGHTLFSN